MSKSGRIINDEFHRLLRECRTPEGRVYTVELLAEGIASGRPHVNQVLLNKPASKGQMFGTGRGGRTRGRLAAFFWNTFPDKAPALLASLGWDNEGRLLSPRETKQIVPRGENHVEQKAA